MQSSLFAINRLRAAVRVRVQLRRQFRQCNKVRQTQLDSYSGHPISANLFWKATHWRPEDISGQWVLDVGCGSGRFAEVALQAGAEGRPDLCRLRLLTYQSVLSLRQSPVVIAA